MSRVRIPSPAPFSLEQFNLSPRIAHRRLDDGWIPSVVHTFHPVLAVSPVCVGPLSDRLATPTAFPHRGNRGGRRLGIGLGDHHVACPSIAPRIEPPTRGSVVAGPNRDRKGVGAQLPSLQLQ